MKTFLMLCMAASLTSCANHHTPISDRNQFVTEVFANVEEINPVEFESQVGEAAATWGLWGALENSYDGNGRDMIAGALFGAFFGGLITTIAEGPRTGYEYHLTATDGEYMIVILDYHPAEVGDCVRVRMASEVRLSQSVEENCN